MNRFIVTTMGVAFAVAAAAGCDEPKPATTPPAQTSSGGAAASVKPAPDDHQHADETKHADGEKEAAAGDDHPNRIALGTKTVDGLTLKATQDEPVKAGGEGAFDLVITGGKPKAVRFWVGTEDGQGSVKAKADEETPDNWHTHVEVPDPLPPGSRFCAEVEPPTGEKFTVSFDLK